VGIALDALADCEKTPKRAEMLQALARIEPRQKLAVLTMACNEGPYLMEFVAHCLAIGAEHVFVYTNDNMDGTDEVLRWLSANAPVTVIAVTVARGVNVQLKNYEHALLLLPELRLYEWVAVVDVDEFLIPGARYGYDLKTMLSQAPRETDVILFPWRWRLWERGFERMPGLLAERFPHGHAHYLFKPVMRLGHVVSLAPVHVPEIAPGAVVRDTAFEVIAESRIWTQGDVKSEAGGWVEHFWGKSFEEFRVKWLRGEAMGLEKLFRRDLENFFKWTGRVSPENYLPVPQGAVARMKAVLTRFAGRPGYAEVVALVEARYAAYAAAVRADTGLRRAYEDMLGRIAAG
jgi:hypothetical protein